MDKAYSMAYTEVLEILSYFSEEEYNKIPKEKIELFERNKDKDYKFTIDPTKDITQQNISVKAKAIIITLFRDYFASDMQKEELNRMLIENENKAEQKKKEKYNSDKLFQNTSVSAGADEEADIDNCKAMIERKENIFSKIWASIRKLFKK